MFTLYSVEADNMEKWLEEHNKTCPFTDPMKQAAAGGRLTYSFTPTGLGVVTRIECACGEMQDLTDYLSW